jgi:hypothetical protein
MKVISFFIISWYSFCIFINMYKILILAILISFSSCASWNVVADYDFYNDNYNYNQIHMIYLENPSWFYNNYYLDMYGTPTYYHRHPHYIRYQKECVRRTYTNSKRNTTSTSTRRASINNNRTTSINNNRTTPISNNRTTRTARPTTRRTTRSTVTRPPTRTNVTRSTTRPPTRSRVTRTSTIKRNHQ